MVSAAHRLMASAASFEGRLTAGTMFPELLRAVERLNGEFERAPLPVGCAFGQLTATADQVLARMD